jgi:hypothetical protein
MRAPAVEPADVVLEVPRDRADRPVNEERPRELILQGSEPAVDDRDSGLAAGAEAPADSAAADKASEAAGEELSAPVAEDPTGLPVVANRATEERTGEGGVGLAGGDAKGQDFPGENVDHGADDEAEEESADPAEVLKSIV